MADARQQQKLTARQRGAGRDGLHGVKDRQFVIRTDANLERQRSPLAQIEPPAEQLHDNERQASGQASRQEYQQSRQQSEPILVANETHEAAHPIQQTQPTRRIEASAPSRLPDPMHPRRVAPRQRGAERADRHQVVDRNFTIQTAARLPRNVISPEPQKLERDTTASSQSSAPMSLVSPSPTPVISSQPSSQSASQRPSRVSSVQPLQTNTISSRMTSPMYGSGHTSSLQRYTSPPPPAMTPFRAARYGSLRTQSPLPVLSAASTPAMDNRTAASLSTDDTVPAHGVVEASPGILSYEILESPVTHFDEHSTVDASRAEPLGDSFTVAADSDDNAIARVPETSPAAVSHERKQSMSPLAAMQRESPQPVDVPAEPELTLQQEDDAEPEERPLKQRRVDGPKTQFRFHRLSNDATGQSLTVFDIVASHIDDIISRQLILRYNGDGGGGSGGDMSGIEESDDDDDDNNDDDSNFDDSDSSSESNGSEEDDRHRHQRRRNKRRRADHHVRNSRRRHYVADRQQGTLRHQQQQQQQQQSILCLQDRLRHSLAAASSNLRRFRSLAKQHKKLQQDCANKRATLVKAETQIAELQQQQRQQQQQQQQKRTRNERSSGTSTTHNGGQLGEDHRQHGTNATSGEDVEEEDLQYIARLSDFIRSIIPV